MYVEETKGPVGEGTVSAPKIQVRSGATAGASSAGFYMYQAQRREENARIAGLEEEKREREADAALARKLHANRSKAEERTAKKAAKRRKRKAQKRAARDRAKAAKRVEADSRFQKLLLPQPLRQQRDRQRPEEEKERLASAVRDASANANAFANDGSFMARFWQSRRTRRRPREQAKSMYNS